METLDVDWIVRSLEDDAESGIALGAHLVSERDGYSHHGIYAGNGQVIHYAGFHHSMGRRPVEAISLRRFSAGRAVGVRGEPGAVYLGSDAVARARSRLGEDRYRLLTNNCEHFCTWCVRGMARSEQVRRCFLNPWTGIKTLHALVRSHHIRRHWTIRVVRYLRSVRGSIAAQRCAAQLGRA